MGPTHEARLRQVHGTCDWAAVLPLYVGGVWWTLLYDTIYAHQDKADDEKVGVLSTARTLGEDKRWLALFGTSTIGSLALAGTTVALHPAYWALLAGGAGHLVWQVSSVNLASRPDCLRKFQSNSAFGAAIFAALVAGKLLLEPTAEVEDCEATSSDNDAAAARCHAPPQRTYALLVETWKGRPT